MKTLVVGNLDAVLGFGLVGVHGWAVSTVSEVHQALDEALEDPEAGIILVTEDAAELVHPRTEQLMVQSKLPLVVLIPGPGGPLPGRASLGEVIQQAIGVRV